MFATMYDAQGIGLAATQVDMHERLIVIDVSETATSPWC
jgi:peptide deformylase